MPGFIWIEFPPSEKTISRILRVIDEGGFVLREIRAIPCCNGERTSLSLDLAGCHFDADLGDLAHLLSALGDGIELIGRAAPDVKAA